MGCVQAWSAHGDLWWEIERYVREREEEMRKQQGG
jgi:hypothetical protein